MADLPGVSPPVPVAPGAAEYQRRLQAGFSQGEVSQWAQQKTAAYQAAGFKPSEIAAYWGNTTPSSAPLAGFVARNVQTAVAADPKIATDPIAAFHAGWGSSVTGLITSGHLPQVSLPENAGLLDRIANGAGQFAGDLPFTVGGFFAGAAAGGGGGAAVAAPTGEAAAPITVPVGAVLGAGFGANAVPEAARQTLMDAYKLRDGSIKTWQDAAGVAGGSLWTTLKTGAVGAVSNLVGGKVGGKILEYGGNELLSAGGNTAANIATATVGGAALEGHMPDAADFETAAVLALSFHAASHIAPIIGKTDLAARVTSNLETLYRQTGIPPWKAQDLAKQSQVFKQEVIAQDANGDPVTPSLRASAPPDPPPAVDPTKTPTQAKGVKPSAVDTEQPKTLSPIIAIDVPHAKSLLASLEGSADDAVSPAGAIGKYQIMPATARYYMGNNFDTKTLFDPAVNSAVADRVVSDLFKRYNGDMNAISIAYNAGPGRAGKYMQAGPGTALEAFPDKTVKGGIRYEQVQAGRDESFLPTETQKYLANERRRMGVTASQQTAAKGEPGSEPGPGQTADDGAIPPYEPPPIKTEVSAGEPGYEGRWQDEIMRNIGEQPQKPSVLNPDRVMGQFVSELTPARRLDDQAIAAGGFDRNKDLGLEDAFRQTYASDARAGVFVRYGAVDAATKDVIPGSNSIMDAVRLVKDAGGNMADWTAHMLAQRAAGKIIPQEGKVAIKTGFNPNAVLDGATDAKSEATYGAGTKMLNDVLKSVLEYSRDSGVHSQAQIDAMMEANPVYLSFRRIIDGAPAGGGKGRGFDASDPLKRMTGSDGQITDPIAATIDNIRAIIRMADRNQAIGAVVARVEDGRLPEGISKLPEPQAADGSPLKQFGYGGNGGPDATDLTAAMQPELAALSTKGSPNDFSYIRDGQVERWTAQSPELAALLQKADSPGQSNVIIKAFQTWAGLERSGIVVDPNFGAKVTLRHQITAFVLDPLHPAPFVTWMKGIGHVIGQDDAYQDAMAKGSMGAALADMDTNWLAKDMDKVFTDTDTWSGVSNAFSHPIEFARLISERMDAAARVGYKLNAEAQGIDPIKAAIMSRKAYLDYSEKATSAIANGMANTIPFFRPHMLGMKQLGEGLVNDPIGVGLRATMALAAPMAALYGLNYLQDKMQDEDPNDKTPEALKWRNVPQWQKDNYYITPLINGTRLRLRTMPGLGFAFGGMINRMLDAASGANPDAFHGAMVKFLSDFVPPLAPPLLVPPIEVMTNHNFGTGHQLIPGSMDQADGYMQYTPNTSEVAKKLSNLLGPQHLNVANFSPIQLDTFVSGWTGTIGQAAEHILDRPLGGAAKPSDIANIPFVGSYFTRNPTLSAQPIETFYNEVSDLKAAGKDFQIAKGRAKGSGDTDEMEETAAGGAVSGKLTLIEKAVSTQINLVQGIAADKTMKPYEKRQAIDQAMDSLIGTANAGIAAVKEAKAALKDAKAAPDTLQAQQGGLPPVTPAPVAQPVQAAPRAPAAPAALPGANRGMVPGGDT